MWAFYTVVKVNRTAAHDEAVGCVCVCWPEGITPRRSPAHCETVATRALSLETTTLVLKQKFEVQAWCIAPAHAQIYVHACVHECVRAFESRVLCTFSVTYRTSLCVCVVP